MLPLHASATRQHNARPPQPVCVFRPARTRHQRCHSLRRYTNTYVRTVCLQVGGETARPPQATTSTASRSRPMSGSSYSRPSRLSHPALRRAPTLGAPCSPPRCPGLSQMAASGSMRSTCAPHLPCARSRPTPPPRARAHAHAAPERRATPLGSLYARARLHHRRVRAHARHLCGARPPWVGSRSTRARRTRAPCTNTTCARTRGI